ncbi:MAG: gamma-glutamyl-gamma-aminobutyrate hydrolase family protein [Candidatus Sericytochromatia bacterium]|nr:gamma-glutamyl-gamma-aminobutyrate hydrolase family protein [Candidatus Sericytochromatia bacterium]
MTSPTQSLAPRIGITGLSTYGRRSAEYRAYSDHVQAAGGIPILLGTPHHRLPANLGGLLLAGGEDVHPQHYDATPHVTYHGNHRRDAAEIALVTAALAQELPILAICRGCQLLNVVLGGSLVQDIPSQTPDPLLHEDGVRHAIAIPAGSRLATLLGTTVSTVNSYHHQAVSRLAPGLMVNARTTDGTIEGFEPGPDASPLSFLMGVQWHRELETPQDSVSQPIFRNFVESARTFRTR